MKKTYSQSQLKEKAQKVFDEYSHVNTVYATTDGNVFIEKNRANLHAGDKLRVFPFERPSEEIKEQSSKQNQDTKTEPAQPNVDDTVKAIKDVQNLDELEQYASDSRKGVKKAYEARKKAIEAVNQIVVQGENLTGETKETPIADNGTKTPENR